MEQLQDTELRQRLNKLKGELSPEDKMRVAIDLGCSLATVDRYLKGNIAKKGFARLLLNQFQKTAA